MTRRQDGTRGASDHVGQDQEGQEQELEEGQGHVEQDGKDDIIKKTRTWIVAEDVDKN